MAAAHDSMQIKVKCDGSVQVKLCPAQKSFCSDVNPRTDLDPGPAGAFWLVNCNTIRQRQRVLLSTYSINVRFFCSCISLTFDNIEQVF